MFVLALLALGFSAKLRDNSVLQYLAAGRALSLPAFVATLVSTWYGGILGVAESVQFFGVGAWTLVGLPYYVFAIVYALFFAPKVREATQISLPERLESVWGKPAALVCAVLIFLLAVPAAHVLMLGVLTHLLTGWGMVPSVWIAAVVGTLFLYRGGLLADVRASLLAFLMMYVGFATILGWCILHQSPAQAWTQLAPEMRRWDGGGGAIAVVSFFILGAWTIVDPGFHQRVASAATPSLGRKGVLVSAGFWMLFDILTIGTALYAFASGGQIGTGLEIFPRFGAAILPDGLRAIFFCGMLGTILCAMIGYTLVSGATFGRDAVARAWQLDESRVKQWTRIGIAVSTLVAIGLGLSLDSVVALWYSCGGCVVGALLIPVCLAYLGKSRIRSGWITASMVVAFVVSFAWLVFGIRTNNALLEVGIIRSDAGMRMVLPPYAPGEPVTSIALGTLVPGLVISSMVLAIGGLARGKERK